MPALRALGTAVAGWVADVSAAIVTAVGIVAGTALVGIALWRLLGLSPSDFSELVR